MRKRWIILVLLVSVAVLLVRFLDHPRQMQQTAPSPEPETAPIPEFKTNLLEYTHHPASGMGMPLYSHE